MNPPCLFGVHNSDVNKSTFLRYLNQWNSDVNKSTFLRYLNQWNSDVNKSTFLLLPQGLLLPQPPSARVVQCLFPGWGTPGQRFTTQTARAVKCLIPGWGLPGQRFTAQTLGARGSSAASVPRRPQRLLSLFISLISVPTGIQLHPVPRLKVRKIL